MTNNRYYNFSLVSYVPINDFIEYISNNSLVKHYAVIAHDMDECESHLHAILCLRNNCTETALYKKFKRDLPNQNTLVEGVKDMEGCFDYLTHENEENKIKYDKELIISDNLEWFESIEMNNKLNVDNSIGIIQDLLNSVPLEEMHLRYGRDFVINYQKYKFFADEVVRDMHARCLEKQLAYRAENGFTRQEKLTIDKVCAKNFMR